jgi:hypothetical protein
LQGGFVSTQDTVVALQALSLYAQSVSKDPTDITIQVKKIEMNYSPSDIFSA